MTSGWPCSYKWASWVDPPSPKTGSANRVLINRFPFYLSLSPSPAPCDDFYPWTMSSRRSPSIPDAPAFRTFAYTYVTQSEAAADEHHSNITWHECELWNCVSELKPRFHPVHITRLQSWVWLSGQGASCASISAWVQMPSARVRMLITASCACNPSTGIRKRQKGPQVLMARQNSHRSELRVQGETLSQNVEGHWRRHLILFLESTCTHISHAHTHTRIYIHHTQHKCAELK